MTMKSAGFHGEIRRISWWNPADFMPNEPRTNGPIFLVYTFIFQYFVCCSKFATESSPQQLSSSQICISLSKMQPEFKFLWAHGITRGQKDRRIINQDSNSGLRHLSARTSIVINCQLLNVSC